MNISPVSMNTNNNYTPNFKGAPKVNASIFSKTNAMYQDAKKIVDKKWDSFIENGVIKRVLQPVMNSKFMAKFADSSANMKNLPSHMATAGSFVTTYFYASRTLRTLNKDEEQKKRAKVLVGNQVMVTGLSTVGAYGLNGFLGDFSKKLGYKFREANQGHPKLSTRMKGFDIAKQLLIFTMMYRYVAPVIVTPFASKLGKVVENYKARKSGKNEAAVVEMNQQPQVAKQVALIPHANTVAKNDNRALSNFRKSA